MIVHTSATSLRNAIASRPLLRGHAHAHTHHGHTRVVAQPSLTVSSRFVSFRCRPCTFWVFQMLLEHGGVTGRTVSTVQEGSENEAFWAALGGPGEYPKESEAETASQEPRLFQVLLCVFCASASITLPLGHLFFSGWYLHQPLWK